MLYKVLKNKYWVTEEVIPPTFTNMVCKHKGWPFCYFNTKYNKGQITIEEIKHLLNQCYDKLPPYDRHKPERHFFTVKRVKRILKDDVRKYINKHLMTN
jgi:hypothetical protein